MDTTSKKSQRMRPLPEDIATVYTEETELHWRRIISAVLFVLALLTTTGWILMNSISAEKAAQVISANPVVELEESAVETTPAVETQPQILQLEEAIAPAAPKAPETFTDLPAEETPQTSNQKVSGESEPLPVEEPHQEPVAAAPAEDSSDEFLDRPAPADAAQVTRDPRYVGTLQLTSRLDDKNPTDSLSAQIKLGQRDLVKIYAYSELTNLKGERVYHDWYRGDKRMARIPVGVYLDDMRASTSKYIDRTMEGDWHLEITRANGEQLGRMDFRVNVDS